jgi:hypothetical protein
VACAPLHGVVSVADPEDQLSHSFHSVSSRCRKRPGRPEKAAGLTDVAAHALRMLQHAQPSLHFPRLDLLVRRILHPGHPVVGCEKTCPGCLVTASRRIGLTLGSGWASCGKFSFSVEANREQKVSIRRGMVGRPACWHGRDHALNYLRLAFSVASAFRAPSIAVCSGLP